MEDVTYGGVTVDRCTECRGIFFDLLEHEELKKIAGSEAIDIGDPMKGLEGDAVDVYNCPKCSVGMVRLVDAHQTHIWYEACSKCYGVFFDAGEFKDFKEESFLDRLQDALTRNRP
jgi:Zn-finger nucleic acid-binding protein